MRDAAVAVVVVNWNGAETTGRCLHSLLALRGPLPRVIVVDNGSTDGSPGLLAREFPQVEVAALPANLGYAAACNVGIERARRADVRYVWLLNNDTVIEPDALAALVAAAERRHAPAIFAPKILTGGASERIWSAGGALRWPWLERVMLGRDAPADACAEPRELAWATGCSLFVPIEVCEMAGPMDERYFLYLEDVDWCLTARRHGVPVWFVPDARISHVVSGSVRTLDPKILRYYDCRNYFLFVFRHAGAVGRTWALLRLLVTFAKTGVRVLVSPSCRHDAYYHAQTRALWDVVRRRSGKAPYADTPIAACAVEPVEAGAP